MASQGWAAETLRDGQRFGRKPFTGGETVCGAKALIEWVRTSCPDRGSSYAISVMGSPPPSAAAFGERRRPQASSSRRSAGGSGTSRKRSAAAVPDAITPAWNSPRSVRQFLDRAHAGMSEIGSALDASLAARESSVLRVGFFDPRDRLQSELSGASGWIDRKSGSSSSKPGSAEQIAAVRRGQMDVGFVTGNTARAGYELMHL